MCALSLSSRLSTLPGPGAAWAVCLSNGGDVGSGLIGAVWLESSRNGQQRGVRGRPRLTWCWTWSIVAMGKQRRWHRSASAHAMGAAKQTTKSEARGAVKEPFELALGNAQAPEAIHKCPAAHQATRNVRVPAAVVTVLPWTQPQIDVIKGVSPAAALLTPHASTNGQD